ncbi:hypothetical protein [Brucella pseudogrignonensis]|uniref:hypothetical protein n=1 Tax=Brucella pseudogrignonensis TaxID=419475 RepID=UPI000CFAC65F|nr:hypothetical protein [Brucella pseudogrignonensis]MQP40944.1 hypothetical protein [Ochrobactrum sp. MYb237]PQZ40899.1 hypothetical protein CQ059_16745 [Brucella pseudogrignonensis]PRA40382.1 hypothetical protein CQ063_12410 [Brucella pseudogrignonensis]PRA68975.1 hypothetical protein CQ055_12295 [Brucella pseudogrignonensis]
MNLSDYQPDILASVNAVLEVVDIDSGAPGEGIVRSSVELAIAYAIRQERIRCIEHAYKHYVHTPHREGAREAALAIAEGKWA